MYSRNAAKHFDIFRSSARVSYATATTLQYVTGMSYFAAVVLVQEPDEAMAYATLVTLLQVTRFSCQSHEYPSWRFSPELWSPFYFCHLNRQQKNKHPGVNRVVARIRVGANDVRDLDSQIRRVLGIYRNTAMSTPHSQRYR